MRITSLEEYGLRCALRLAAFKTKNELANAPQIAELEGLSVEYVSKIMHLFKKANLVNSTRGTQGGFSLAQRPSDISVKNVLDTLAASKKHNESLDDFCGNHKGSNEECRHRGQCTIRPVWLHIFDVFDKVLTSITLADLLVGAPLVSEKIRNIEVTNSQLKEQIR